MIQRLVISIIFQNLFFGRNFPTSEYSLQEKKSFRGFHVEFLGVNSVYITIMLQKWGPRWNLRERMCERMVRIGLGSVEERSLSRLGEPSCCSGEQRRRREPMPATAAQCFGERETRQRASTPFHNLVPQQLSQGTKREMEGEVVDFNVLVETETLAPHALRRRRRTAFSCCRGNRLQRSVPE